jgi:transcriptional regulator with XRE-family HTH domain
LLKTLGVKVRSLRLERGLSQEALADLAHIDRSYMSSIERGLRNLSVISAARIAAALQVPLCDLLQTRGQVGSFEVAPDVPRRPRLDIEPEWQPGHYLSLG